MATMNQVQFQPGMSITKFMELYGSQEQCEIALEKCRWHDGFVCPMCARKEYYVVWHGNAKTFQCFDLSNVLKRLLLAAVATGSRTEAWCRLAEDQR